MIAKKQNQSVRECGSKYLEEGNVCGDGRVGDKLCSKGLKIAHESAVSLDKA